MSKRSHPAFCHHTTQAVGGRRWGLRCLSDLTLHSVITPHRPLVVGDGPAMTKVKEELLGNPIILGHLDTKNLSTAFASADIFFFPSLTETWGNVALEAMVRCSFSPDNQPKPPEDICSYRCRHEFCHNTSGSKSLVLKDLVLTMSSATTLQAPRALCLRTWC
jgi:hypothetical protein